jgi:ArsR family transcriptional regulator
LADGKTEVIGQNGVNAEIAGPISEEQVERLVALGHALSDPIRVRMIGMMAEGRGWCDLPDLGVPAEDADNGICICEFEEYFGMGQSKVSYHMRKLKEAGLVREERRGKWSFYSFDREAAGELIGEAADQLLSGSERRVVSGGGC